MLRLRWNFAARSSSYAQHDNSSLPYSVDNFFYESIRVASVGGDFGGVAGDRAVGQFPARFFQQSVAQHGNQTRLPVLGTTLQRMLSGLQICFKVADGGD